MPWVIGHVGVLGSTALKADLGPGIYIATGGPSALAGNPDQARLLNSGVERVVISWRFSSCRRIDHPQYLEPSMPKATTDRPYEYITTAAGTLTTSPGSPSRRAGEHGKRRGNLL